MPLSLNSTTALNLSSIAGLIGAGIIILLVGLVLGGPWPRRTLIALIVGGAIASAVLRLIVLIL